MGAAAVPIGVAGASSVFSAYEIEQAGASNASYYNYLANVATTNAELAGAATISEKRQIGAQAHAEQIALTNKIAETVGTQKAALVGGAGTSSRTAQDIISDTLTKGNLDEMALRLNADIRSKNAEIAGATAAMNFGTQASGYRIAGANARTAAGYGKVKSLLSGANAVASSWYMGNLYAKTQTPAIGSIE